MRLNNVLLIDDDIATNLIVKAILQGSQIVENYNFCLSGWDALEYLEKCKDKDGFPEIVFVDLNMPEMDGYEFISNYEEKFYQAHPDTKIVVVTSSTRSKDLQQSLSYKSVSKFINKPLSEEKIKSVVNLINN